VDGLTLSLGRSRKKGLRAGVLEVELSIMWA